MSILIKLYSLKMCSLLYIYFTSIKLKILLVRVFILPSTSSLRIPTKVIFFAEGKMHKMPNQYCLINIAVLSVYLFSIFGSGFVAP
jgi:phosphotransacetylase